MNIITELLCVLPVVSLSLHVTQSAMLLQIIKNIKKRIKATTNLGTDIQRQICSGYSVTGRESDLGMYILVAYNTYKCIISDNGPVDANRKRSCAHTGRKGVFTACHYSISIAAKHPAARRKPKTCRRLYTTQYYARVFCVSCMNSTATRALVFHFNDLSRSKWPVMITCGGQRVLLSKISRLCALAGHYIHLYIESHTAEAHEYWWLITLSCASSVCCGCVCVFDAHPLYRGHLCKQWVYYSVQWQSVCEF